MRDQVSVFEDAFNLLCGAKVGDGMSRTVFECELWKGHVVKVEKDPHRFQNVLEWEVWRRVSETSLCRWFAPCKHLSPNGQILIMERTYPAPPDLYPKKMPAFFTDMKRENFGILDGKLVCHDYAVNLLMERGMTRAFRNADWWSNSD